MRDDLRHSSRGRLYPARSLAFSSRGSLDLLAATKILVMASMGICGVGAFYYLMFGLEYARGAMAPLLPTVLDAIVLSVLLHGSTANYLLRRYFGRRR
jgi:hypothetical protein